MKCGRVGTARSPKLLRPVLLLPLPLLHVQFILAFPLGEFSLPFLPLLLSLDSKQLLLLLVHRVTFDVVLPDAECPLHLGVVDGLCCQQFVSLILFDGPSFGLSGRSGCTVL